MIRLKPLSLALALASISACQVAPHSTAGIDGTLLTFKRNGGFNWFLDNRAILDGDKLILGSVAGTTRDGSTYGDVQITTYDLAKNTSATATLAPAFATDDHMLPVLLKRNDGRYLAAFSKHDLDGLMRWTISTNPGDASAWGPVQTVNANTVDAHGMCFSNLIQVPPAPNAAAGTPGRIYNFARSVGDDPNYLISDDNGTTFKYGGHLLTWDNPDPKNPGRPYIKYATSGTNQIWLACTEDHPSEYNTGIYAGFIRNGRLSTSTGTSLGAISTTTDATIKPTQLTQIFKGMPDAIAYLDDLKVAPDGHPVVTFSVRKDDGHDIRYWYARFDGRAWQSQEIAHAGSTIYMGEANYAGLATIDGANPWNVFISANSDPKTGEPLKSTADGKRHFEIYKGTTADKGATWSWSAVTTNSPMDNIRPVVPARADNRRVLMWLRGTMTTYKNYSLDIVGTVEDAGPPMQLPLHMQARIIASPKTDSTLAANARNVDARLAQDGLDPKSSNDNRPLSHFDWWPDHNTSAWIDYEWAKPQTLTSTEVYWFDDTGSGECRPPTSWKVLYKDGDAWKPVETSDTPGVAKDKYNKITFKPVTTTALRLEIVFAPTPADQPRAKISCGIQEWKVNGE